MRSMTAFGRATVAGEGYELTVELRSVNNRYLDLNFRLPRAWAAQEERIKAALSTMGVARGKVDISVTLTDTRAQSGAALLEPDMDAARRYLEAAQAQMTREGITLQSSVDDDTLTIMYAAWMWRRRDSGEGMPRMLRYAINNRLFAQKAGAGQ